MSELQIIKTAWLHIDDEFYAWCDMELSYEMDEFSASLFPHEPGERADFIRLNIGLCHHTLGSVKVTDETAQRYVDMVRKLHRDGYVYAVLETAPYEYRKAPEWKPVIADTNAIEKQFIEAVNRQ